MQDILCSDSYGNRTRVTAVKGRCLNRLTKEPSSLSIPKPAYVFRQLRLGFHTNKDYIIILYFILQGKFFKLFNILFQTVFHIRYDVSITFSHKFFDRVDRIVKLTPVPRIFAEKAGIKVIHQRLVGRFIFLKLLFTSFRRKVFRTDLFDRGKEFLLE